MILRDYQIQTVRDFEDAIQSHSRIVISYPTGGGKTALAVHGILPLLKHPVAWVTHRRELAHQIKEFGTSMDVVMSQSPSGGKYKSIIIDEAHHSCADQYMRIINNNSKSMIVALTATPYRMDGRGLGECGFTKIIHGPDIFELTSLGYLCPATVLVPVSELNKSWTNEEVAARVAKTKFNKAIVYCRSVTDSVAVAKILSCSGIKAESVSSDTCGRRRESHVKRFKRGGLRVICNHTIFTEGNDIPTVDAIVLNRFTESRCLWRQMTGRGLRATVGKHGCTILDLAGNGVFHGSIYDEEVFDLSGRVETTNPREAPSEWEKQTNEYKYNEGEELKEWKPKLRPKILIENLQKLRSQSSLLRLLIG